MIRVEQLLARGPLVLAFVRGLWCEHSRLDLAALDKATGPLRDTGAVIAAILRYSGEDAVSYADTLRVRFPLLNDKGGRVAEAFGLRSGRPDDLACKPARFVIAPEGMITFGDAYPDYVHRPDPLELLPVIGRFR